MLNIKGNPSLQNLDCRSCALQSLDLSGNPALQYIDCSSNYVLRTVDVRPCLSLFRFTGLDSVETVCVTAKQFSSTTLNVHPNTRILIQSTRCCNGHELLNLYGYYDLLSGICVLWESWAKK